MGHGHDHGLSEVRHEKPLWWALGLTGTFLVVEVIGGLLDQQPGTAVGCRAHGDRHGRTRHCTGRRAPGSPATGCPERTFGYARLEALGALANGALLLGVAAYILWEAVGRFRDPPPVAATGMIVVAVAGLVVNLIAMRLLKAGSGESLNVKGAYLEVWSDMLGSLGVLIAAVLIQLTGWLILDPILAVLIGLWVLPRTWTLAREAINVLLEGVPHGTDVSAVRTAILGQPGVTGVHDLHIWALGSKQAVLAAHVIADTGTDVDALRRRINESLHDDFGIEHSTLQVESSDCGVQDCGRKSSAE